MVKCFVTIQSWCKRYRVRKDDFKEIHHLKKRVLRLPCFEEDRHEWDAVTAEEEEFIKMWNWAEEGLEGEEVQ